MNTLTTVPKSSNLSVGGLAFLAGVVATLLTAYAVVSRKPRETKRTVVTYDGWDDSLGV
jgi:hypothetical protein